MHDIKFIRSNPEAFDAGMARRGLAPQSPEILKLDAEKRKGQTLLQEMQSHMNALSKDIGAIKSKNGDATALMEQVKALKDSKAVLEAELAGDHEGALGELLSSLPNIPADDVPQGKDEKDNKQVREWGAKPSLAFKAKEHFELGEKLG